MVDRSLDEKYQARYRELCRKLDMMEMIEKSGDSQSEDRLRLPLPSYQMLLEHYEEENMKIESFLAGKQSFERNIVSNVKENDIEGADPRIPLLDHKAQQQLRRRLVLGSLLKHVPAVLKLIHLNLDDVRDELRNLVHSFSFTPENVVLKRDEWTIVSIMLLKLLTHKNNVVQSSMETSESKKTLSLVLLSFQTDLTQIEVVIRDSTADIKQLVSKL